MTKLIKHTIIVQHLLRHPSILVFVGLLSLFTIAIVLLSEGLGVDLVPTSFIKTLGKTLCLCMVAIAMDLVWGFCGILSLGHFAFFALGGYMIGMWLMFARTKIIVLQAAQNAPLPMSLDEVNDAVGTQIFGVVGGADIPVIWTFADMFWVQVILVFLIPGFLAFVFGLLISLIFATLGEYMIEGLTTIPSVQNAGKEYLGWLVVMPLVSVLAFQFDGIFIGTTHLREMRNNMLISVLVYFGCLAITLDMQNHGLWLSMSVFMAVRGITLSMDYPKIVKKIE